MVADSLSANSSVDFLDLLVQRYGSNTGLAVYDMAGANSHSYRLIPLKELRELGERDLSRSNCCVIIAGRRLAPTYWDRATYKWKFKGGKGGFMEGSHTALEFLEEGYNSAKKAGFWEELPE